MNVVGVVVPALILIVVGPCVGDPPTPDGPNDDTVVNGRNYLARFVGSPTFFHDVADPYFALWSTARTGIPGASNSCKIINWPMAVGRTIQRPDFTRALVEVCAETSGDLQSRCREALAQRMARFKPSVLHDYLTGPDREMRLAAAWGSGLREKKDLIPALIPALNDKDPLVAQKAYESLKVLAGQDFGMDAARWTDWWTKQGSGGK